MTHPGWEPKQPHPPHLRRRSVRTLAICAFVCLGAPLCCAQGYQQNVSANWDFTTAATPLGWYPLNPLSNFGIANGALTFTATQETNIVYSSPISVPTVPLQLVEVVMSCDTAGQAVLYWAPAQTGVYGGFQPGDQNVFVALGDGVFHHYYLPIDTSSAPTIYQLRLDVPLGATVSLQSVALVNLVAPSGPGVAPVWNFASGTDAQGWIPYSGVFDMSVASGQLQIQTYTNAMILAPLAQVTNQIEWFTLVGNVSQTSLQNPWILFNYVSTGNAGNTTTVYFPVVADSATHIYNENVGGENGWWSTVSQLSLTIPENTTIAINEIQISNAAQGPADLAVDSFGPATSLVRAGVPFQISCRVLDRGSEPVQGLSVNLVVPTGVQVTASPDVPASLSNGYPETLVWTLVSAQAGSFPVSVSASAGTGGNAQGSATILVNPAVSATPSPYVPIPAPVQSNYDVGVYYFPGWSLYSHWDPIRSFPERMPALGYYAEGDPQVLDWQIKWAVEHGIKFFGVEWYWGSSLQPQTQQGEWPNNFLKAFSSASYRGYIQFSIVYANDTSGDSASSVGDFMNIAAAWINEYFGMPEYYKINQKPVVILTNPSLLDSTLGGSSKQALDAARQMAVQAGFPGIYFIGLSDNTVQTSQFVADGYDALSAYGYGKAATFDPDQGTYSSLVNAYPGFWDSVIAASNVPYLIPTEPGNDNTPWGPYDAPFEFVNTGPTPAEFQQMLEMAKSRIDSGKAPGIVFVTAWNELGEGNYVEPTTGQGFGNLDAIRSVFVGDSSHIDLAPADIGLPLVQALPSNALWTFTSPSDITPWLVASGPPFNSGISGVTNSQIVNNEWTFTSPGYTDMSRSSFVISALDYSQISITMSTSVDASVAIYYGAVDEPSGSAQRVVPFTTPAGPAQTYTLTLAGQPGWRGMINFLRVTISSPVSVNVAIQSIQFLSSSSVASIATSPAQLQFTGTEGGATPTPQTISLAGATGAALSWTAAPSTSWLAVSPASGATPGNVSIAVNPTGMAAGVYDASVTITASGATNTPQTIPVTLWVLPALPTPQIYPGGIISASGFGGSASVAPGSWIEIYGTNLATNARGWTGLDFNGSNAPVALDQTSVSVGGQPAFVAFISPGQVNVQLPTTISAGPQPVTITNGNGTSSAYTLNVSSAAPGLLAPAAFNIGGTQYVAALFPDNSTYVLPEGAIAGVNSRPAQPGDVIILYGVGFGPVTPSAPAGQLVGQPNALTSQMQVFFAGTPATVTYAGLAPGEIGLYQFNVTVPDVAASNAVPLTFTLGGVAGTQTLYIAVQN